METRRGRVLRLTAVDEFNDVQAILQNWMGGAAPSGTATLDYCIRATLEALNAKAETQKKRAKPSAREYASR